MVRSIFRAGLRETDMVTAGDSAPAGTWLATPGLDTTFGKLLAVYFMRPPDHRALRDMSSFGP